MSIKNILVVVFVLTSFNNIVHGESNNSIVNQSSFIISANESNVHEANQLNDIFLRELELEREFLAQKQQTYDTFLTIILVWLTLFSIILLAISIVAYKNIRELKKDVKKELDKDLSEKAQRIIKETMKSTYEKPISDLAERVTQLEKYVDYLKKGYIEKGQKKLPEYLEEKEMAKKEQQNIFDEL